MPFITLEKAVTHLKMTSYRVLDGCVRGQIKHRMDGHLVFVDREDCEKWKVHHNWLLEEEEVADAAAI